MINQKHLVVGNAKGGKDNRWDDWKDDWKDEGKDGKKREEIGDDKSEKEKQ